jgi:hypothetical protein
VFILIRNSHVSGAQHKPLCHWEFIQPNVNTDDAIDHARSSTAYLYWRANVKSQILAAKPAPRPKLGNPTVFHKRRTLVILAGAALVSTYVRLVSADTPSPPSAVIKANHCEHSTVLIRHRKVEIPSLFNNRRKT